MLDCTLQFSKKLFSLVFNFHLKFTNQKGRHYKKIAIPTTLLLFHFFQFDRYFIPSKVTEIDSERIEFSFRKKIESFYCIVWEIIRFKVKTNQKRRRYSISVLIFWKQIESSFTYLLFFLYLKILSTLHCPWLENLGQTWKEKISELNHDDSAVTPDSPA